jgi:hypothetical protein
MFIYVLRNPFLSISFYILWKTMGTIKLWHLVQFETYDSGKEWEKNLNTLCPYNKQAINIYWFKAHVSQCAIDEIKVP